MAGIGSLTGTALNSLYNLNQGLLNAYTQLSTGKQINSAADNPSGLAIYTALSNQAAGFDQGSLNAQDALNATNVAEGGAQSITGILGSLNVEGIAASNDLLAPQDQQSIQAQATQQLQQINTIAQNTNFNGIGLLNGQFAGTQAATPASSAVPNNDLLLSTGQNVINTGAGITTPAATPGETIQISVSAGQATVNVTNTATGVTTNAGSFASGATLTAGGVTFTLGNFGTNDTGNATLQVTGAQGFAPGNAATVQTGANQGATTSLNFGNLTTESLGVSNVNFGTTFNAENGLGSISTALNSVLTAQAQLGAQATSLQNQINSNNIASTNLTASASNIADANYPNAVDNFTKLNSQSLITLNVLRNANLSAGFLSAGLLGGLA
ncbi:MAG: flagellin [Candidatus Eremiobacteraeota bacterium]|nr:flagellin [Candidatus Eremiobacteraeota bacterium]